MTTPKLEKIWIGMWPWNKDMELRLDWSNDYHPEVIQEWLSGLAD